MLDISKSTNDELIERLDYCGYDPYYNDLRQAVIAEIKLRMGEYDKQTPVPVVKSENDGLIYGRCPRCGKIMDNQRYCGNCGQAVIHVSPHGQKPGRWIFYFDDKSGRDGYKCSECDSAQPWYYDYFEHFEFCPHCGAKMSE